MTKDTVKISKALGCLSPPLRAALEPHIGFISREVTDIRVRQGLPLAVSTRGGIYYPSNDGGLLQTPSDKAVIISKTDIGDSFNRICRYSVYSVQGELVNGFVTVSGGHRAGICGTAVVGSGGIINIRDISSINLRLSREVKGCAVELMKRINAEKGVLIFGEPCSGKTTILRDAARYISLTENKAVSLIDERGELAAAVRGENQNDVGMCDVFSGYPKLSAAEQALRCMSPDFIILDELGTADDVKAVEGCSNSGVAVIAALHAADKAELLNKPNAVRLLKTQAFGSVVFLDSRKNAGRIREIARAGELLAG